MNLRSLQLARALNASKTTTTSTTDPLDHIKKLKELFDADIITEEEYNEKRNKLLARI